MKHVVFYTVYFCILAKCAVSHRYHNETILPDAANQQLPEFRDRHSVPIGLFTKITGEPMDIRDTVTLNTELFDNRNFFRTFSHQDRERVPNRVVHSEGNGAFGYFEVTRDVSRYTKADVFNKIGKKTPVVARFSSSITKFGGSDLNRDIKAIALKMYTNEGNLDFITFHIPVYLYKDNILFSHIARATAKNPRTNVVDNGLFWDIMTLKPEAVFGNLFFMSDLGIPDGFRKTNYFPIHAYEIYNKYGETFYVRFNFWTETGVYNLTNAEQMAIAAEDPDYYGRDLYDSIAAKQYPSWRLDMDILTADQLTNLPYDPFDMTRLWKRGTYKTVTIGRLVMNRRIDNQFKDVEQAGFTPDNLVPGIGAPPDQIFKARRFSYPDTHNHRIGVNHPNIAINAPRYKKTYSRDGAIPAADNMRDAPNYFPNSFNGPVPYVDEARPKVFLKVYNSNAVDLQPVAEFYNEILESDAHRQRVAENVARTLEPVASVTQARALRILTLIDVDFGKRVKLAIEALRQVSNENKLNQLTQCFLN